MKNLSKTERAFFANQNRILALLSEQNEDAANANHYNHLADIAECGYEGLYYELLENISEGVSKEICKETHDILTMYRIINSSIAKLTEEQRLSLEIEKIEFEGFDANNDSHYGFMEFLIEKEGKYVELKDMYRNSHNSYSIEKYRRLLEIYQERNKVELYLPYEVLRKMIEN